MALRSSIEASAPGSIMLLGEHAVLHGRRALACAVSCRIHVRLRRRSDGLLTVSSVLGRCTVPLTELRPEGPLRFVLSAVREAGGSSLEGIEMDVESEFSPTVGLGSSAAVTVAVVAGLQALDHPRQPMEIFERSLRAVRAVQGVGSGTDVAASVWGGIVAYRAEPFDIRPLRRIHPITLIYSGSKKPTVEVVEEVETARRKEPVRYEKLFDEMDQSVNEAEDAIGQGDWPRLGRILDRNQELMTALGVSNAPLDAILELMRASPDLLGAKISGSGLGDCVVGLGSADLDAAPFETIPVSMSEEGVRLD